MTQPRASGRSKQRTCRCSRVNDGGKRVMLEILKKFQDICSEPYTGLAEWKKKGNRRIIGCLPMHLPEEIIHAAGILPVTILGSKRPVTAAERCLPPYFCHPGRVMLDLA